MDQHNAEIQEMLDWVHRQARPRPGIDVLVMEVVDGPVERRPVNGSVDPVKVELAPKRDGAEPQCAVNRMRLPVQDGDPMIRRGPEVKCLVCRPDRAPTQTTPEDIVKNLIPEQKLWIIARLPAGVILALRTLESKAVKHQVPTTGGDPQQREIAEIKQADPIRAKTGTPGGSRLEQHPGGDRDQKVNRIPGPQEPREGQKPLKQFTRSRRPDKHGGISGRIGRLPLAPDISRARFRGAPTRIVQRP
jgi:hypothetical protein